MHGANVAAVFKFEAKMCKLHLTPVKMYCWQLAKTCNKIQHGQDRSICCETGALKDLVT